MLGRPNFILSKNLTMSKEIRQDLFTQAEYARLMNKTRAWVSQQIRAGNLKTLTIKGATLIKV
jgi:hypothetical protein